MKKISYVFIFGVILSLILINTTAFAAFLGVKKTLPTDGQKVGSVTPTLKWNSVSGANAYEIIIKNFDNCISGGSVWDVFITSASSIQVPAGILVADKSYNWCVKAVKTEVALLPDRTYTFAEIEKDNRIMDSSPACIKNSSYDEIKVGECDLFSTASVGVTPATPTVSSPKGATVFPLILKWGSVSYSGTPAKYKWKISGWEPAPTTQDPNARKTLPSLSGQIDKTQIDADPKFTLTVKGNYTWQVQACTADYSNCSPQSLETSFTVSLDKFNLLLPKNLDPVATTVKLDWEDVPGAESYKVYWMPEGATTFTSATVSKDQSLKTISGLTLDKTYTWYVVALKNEKEFKSLEQWKFTPRSSVTPPSDGTTPPPSGGTTPPPSEGTPGPTGAPSIPTNLSPCNKTNISSAPTLSWKDVTAGKYNVYIEPFSKLPTSFETYRASVKLDQEAADYYGFSEIIPLEGTYYWWVEACNDTDKCSQSKTCSFSTKEEIVGKPPGGAGGEPPSSVVGGVSIGCKKEGVTCPSGAVCIENPLCAGSINELINAITNFIFWMGIVIAPIILIIAGFMYVTSAGDPNRVGTAKKMILYAVIGLAVILLAKGLVAVLKSIIGVR